MTSLNLEQIRRDGGTQPRDHINMDVAQEYAEALADGAEFPPITVFYDGAEYWLADGFHRVVAHELLGLCDVSADVRQGTLRDAVLCSVGANAAHGYRRTNADKRRAVLTLLSDPEWRGWSNSEIARRANVSAPFVSGLRPSVTINVYSEISPRTEEQEAKIEEVVERLSHGMITRDQANARIATIDPQWAARPSDREARTYITKHGTHAVMNIAGIGKRDGSEYDWQSANTRNAAIQAIRTLAASPPVPEVLAAWQKHTGYALPPETVECALTWLREFHLRYPEAEAARVLALASMLERIDRVAS